MNTILNDRRRLAAAVVTLLCVLLLGGGAIMRHIPGLGETPKAAAAADEGPGPGVAGENPCGNREVQNPQTTAAYYKMVGETLREEGNPMYAEFNGDDPAWIKTVTELVLGAEAGQAVVPGSDYYAKTAWCPGWDVDANGNQTERKPEWVNGGKPLHYAAGKAYWVLFEDEDTLVVIFVDCHNLAVIHKSKPVETTAATVPAPVVTPAATPAPTVVTPPPDNSTPPPTEGPTSTVKKKLCKSGPLKGQPVPENGVCPKDPEADVNVNPEVPAQVRGPGQTPVGEDPGPAQAPVDSPTGCDGPCATTAPTTATTVAAPGSGGSGDGTPLTTPGGNAGVSRPVAGDPSTTAVVIGVGDPGAP